jgi:rhomboid protease GluP
MLQEHDSWVVVAEGSGGRRRGAEAGLVLAARGIDHQLDSHAGRWRLSVPIESEREARAELEQYASENRHWGERPEPIRELSSGWWGVWVYAVLLLSTAILVRQDVLGFDWYAAGRLDTSLALSGQWWRVVTALFLHAGLAHLLGNLAFGVFFGHFVARHLGEGVGWGAILLAGALGDTLNTLVQPLGHRSIGASTAVFGALGILAAYSWRRGLLKNAPWKTRIAPIVAGIALLAYTGTGGENTDVIAHLAGFVVGLVLGATLASAPLVDSRRVQRLCAAVSLAIIVGAWGWGIAIAG